MFQLQFGWEMPMMMSFRVLKARFLNYLEKLSLGLSTVKIASINLSSNINTRGLVVGDDVVVSHHA